jgi:hypothetical protein
MHERKRHGMQKKEIFLFDIDGTLALMDGRGPYEWARVGEDKPNLPVIRILGFMLRQGEAAGFVTGRMEQCRDETREWLWREIPDMTYIEPLMWMRADGDYRPDEVVKREIYENEIAPYYEVQGVFDDRSKVVAAWRSLGLACFQVAPGNF